MQISARFLGWRNLICMMVLLLYHDSTVTVPPWKIVRQAHYFGRGGFGLISGGIKNRHFFKAKPMPEHRPFREVLRFIKRKAEPGKDKRIIIINELL